MILYHAPAANTDGDSLVFFRHSEVISAGDLLSTVSYPVIDVDKGGSIQGVIDGLNRILDLAVAEYRGQGGTLDHSGPRPAVGHGRRRVVPQHADDHSRSREGLDRSKGMTLEQVKAARPTMDFDGRYGSTTGPWTTDMFIEAVYQEALQEKKNDAQISRVARDRGDRWPARLGVRAPFLRGDLRRHARRSSSKASWCSSSTAIRTRSCTSQAPDENGELQRWAVEWGGTTQLDDAGVKRESLKVGDDVVIIGRPSRVPGEYRALMVNLKRPSDGFTWGSAETAVD